MLHIVLDIDNVLADAVGLEEALDDKEPVITFWYKDNGLSAISPHILFPAVLEFIQYLFRIPNCRISFFSSGPEERNTLFVKELLMRALGAEPYEKIKENVCIFSRQHLQPGRDSRTRNSEFQGKKKKDLNITLLPGISLSSTIMIDDDFSYCVSGQEKNFLKVKTIHRCNINDAANEKVNEEYLYRVNNIFYVVGLLKTVIDNERSSPIDNLFELQFKKSSKEFEPLENLGEIPEYFLIGLLELRKINPLLNFYGNAERVRKCFNEDLLPSRDKSLELHHQHKIDIPKVEPIERKLEAKKTATSPTSGSTKAIIASTSISKPPVSESDYIMRSWELTTEACSSPDKAERIIRNPELLDQLLQSASYGGGEGGDISVKYALAKIAESHPKSAILILETKRIREALSKADLNNYALTQIAKAHPYSEKVQKLCGVDIAVQKLSSDAKIMLRNPLFR